MIAFVNENAGCISIILSALTIVCAVIIPTTIARRQNKITLFDKRVAVFERINELFKYPFLYSIAFANAMGAKIGKRAPYDKDTAELRYLVKFLFSKEASVIFEKIMDNYCKMYSCDECIEQGVASVECKNSDNLKEVLQLIQSNALYGLTMEEKMQLENLSKKLKFIYSYADDSKEEKIECDFYELSKKQEALSGENIKLQKEFMELISKEITLSNHD